MAYCLFFAPLRLGVFAFNCIAITTFLFSACEATTIEAKTMQNPLITPITLEHAVTRKQIAWGLMRRCSLPENQGMTFTLSPPEKASFWSFNCFMDLSLAYLDENKVIRELHELKSFPEKMKELHPVTSLVQVSYLPKAFLDFFISSAAVAAFPVSYALEMNPNWFKKNNVRVGDLVIWNPETSEGYISHTLDISSVMSDLAPSKNGSITITFEGREVHGIWMPENAGELTVTFMDSNNKVIAKGALQGGKGVPSCQKAVFISPGPVKQAIISLPQS